MSEMPHELWIWPETAPFLMSPESEGVTGQVRYIRADHDKARRAELAKQFYARTNESAEADLMQWCRDVLAYLEVNAMPTRDEKELEAENSRLTALLPRWRKVEEESPQAFSTVLVTGGLRVEAAYRDADLYWRSELNVLSGVTHWMPLPEIPK